MQCLSTKKSPLFIAVALSAFFVAILLSQDAGSLAFNQQGKVSAIKRPCHLLFFQIHSRLMQKNSL